MKSFSARERAVDACLNGNTDQANFTHTNMNTFVEQQQGHNSNADVLDQDGFTTSTRIVRDFSSTTDVGTYHRVPKVCKSDCSYQTIVDWRLGISYGLEPEQQLEERTSLRSKLIRRDLVTFSRETPQTVCDVSRVSEFRLSCMASMDTHVLSLIRWNNEDTRYKEGFIGIRTVLTEAAVYAQRLMTSPTDLPRTLSPQIGVLHPNVGGRLRPSMRSAQVRTRDVQVDESDISKEVMRCALTVPFRLEQRNGTSHFRSYIRTIRNRQFAIVSCFFKSPESFTHCICVVLQTRSRPPRAIAVNIVQRQAGRIQGDLSFVCTCEDACSVQEPASTACEHIRTCQEDVRLIHFVTSAFRAFGAEEWQGGGGDMFGDPIDLSDIERAAEKQSPTLELDGFEEDSDLHHRSAMQNVQWKFWLAVDVFKCILVPVLKPLRRAFYCLLCRASHRATFEHERACQSGWDVDEADEEAQLPSSPMLAAESIARVHDAAPNAKNDAYYSNGKWRTIGMCKTERELSRALADCIDKSKAGERLGFQDFEQRSCKVCSKCPEGNSKARARLVTLFTLAHGCPEVVFLDWTCRSCGSVNLFSGERHAIFPATRYTAYTTELLYVCLMSMCYQGHYFRDTYEMTMKYRTADSSTERFRNGREYILKGDKRRNRRRANAAFRKFLRTIDTDSKCVTDVLFSCTTCDNPLNEKDMKLLGLCAETASGLRRLNGVVIDGTSAGILGKLPKFDRPEALLTVKHRLRRDQRILSNQESKDALKGMRMACMEALLSVWGRSTKLLTAWHGSTLSFCVSHARRSMDGSNLKRLLSPALVEKLQWFLQESPCFCVVTQHTSNGMQSMHSATCRKTSARLEKIKGATEVRSLLRAVFSLSRWPMLPLQAVEGEEEGDGGGEQEEPFEGEGPDHLQEAQDVSHGDVGDSPSEAQNITNSQASGRTEDTTAAQVQVWVTLNPIKPHRVVQLVDASSALLNVILTDNSVLVQVPNVGLLRSITSTGVSEMPEAPMDAHGRVTHGIHVLSANARQLHMDCKERLQTFHDCQHRSNYEWPCEECTIPLQVGAELLRNINPNLSRFLNELYNATKVPSDARTWRSIAERMAQSIDDNLRCGELYSTIHGQHVSNDCLQYWERFGSMHQPPLPNPERYTAERTGLCFPGRIQRRFHIRFDSQEQFTCNKKYPISEKYTPGLLTVQCTCTHPKLLGFVVMTRAESTALALSAVLSHFHIPPRVVYYDNACNLYYSVMLRVPWIAHITKIVVDRFHYKAHTCFTFFDPDWYRTLDAHRSSTAESINALIKKAAHHMRYVRGDNLIPFLRARFALLNLASIFLQREGHADLEDEDIGLFFENTFNCTCCNCAQVQISEEVAEESDPLTYFHNNILRIRLADMASIGIPVELPGEVHQSDEYMEESDDQEQSPESMFGELEGYSSA